MTVVSMPRFRRMYVTLPGSFAVGIKVSEDGCIDGGSLFSHRGSYTRNAIQFGSSGKCWIVVIVYALFLAQFNKYITRFEFRNFPRSDNNDCEAMVRSGSD
jgi:hypothetical protein